MDYAICIAPMMDWTDRHCRYFHRLLSPHARLYTEMVTTGAVLHGDRARLLDFDAAEQPLALQLGGSDPADLARAARIGEDWGYAEINLNVGCPSDRVQSGRFGACLMREPELVASCVLAMRAAVAIPVTVKCRIGVDDQDDEADLHRFTQSMVEAGVETLIVHARKAWLQGLSPKENRDIPPLNYARVHKLRQQFPALRIVINGGIASAQEALLQLRSVHGVMLGRAAYHDPFVLAQLEHEYYATPLADRDAVLRAMRTYTEQQLADGQALKHIARHVLGLYQGLPGARVFRRYLSENMHRPGADFSVVEHAISSMRQTARAA